MSLIDFAKNSANLLASRRGESGLLVFGIVVLGVVCFLTTRPGHDWGGDFAQYIQHARNIAAGREYADTGYVYSRYYTYLAPRTYPPGFPLLLVPFYYLFGPDVEVFKLLVAFFYVASFAMCVLYFRERVPPLLSLAGSALLFFNPWMLNFKNQIISDMPFLFFLLLSLFWVRRAYRAERPAVLHAMICGILFACAAAIRTPGVLLVPALLVFDIYRHKRLTRFALLCAAVALSLIIAMRCAFGTEKSYLD